MEISWIAIGIIVAILGIALLWTIRNVVGEPYHETEALMISFVIATLGVAFWPLTAFFCFLGISFLICNLIYRKYLRANQ